MKIVIDLPEKTIAHIRSSYGHGKGFYPLNEEDKKIVNDAIYFGTRLPRGHGRLIDADRVKHTLDVYVLNEYDGQFIRLNDIDSVPTIIEGEW